MPKASHGYGGKFGVQNDRMDKVRAVSAAGGGAPPTPPPPVCASPAATVWTFILYLNVTVNPECLQSCRVVVQHSQTGRL